MAEEFNIQFQISLSGRSDGTLEAMYIRLRKGTVARTEEKEDDVLLCDYDRRGNLLGIEILAPVTLNKLARLVSQPVRQPFRRFVTRTACLGEYLGIGT
jgi:uncharacterized protein YuzE